MKFLEKDLEEIIWDAYKNDKLSLINNRGLFINGLIKRQLRIGNYGIADLVQEEEFLKLMKSKLKGGKILKDMFQQLKKIVKKMI